MSKLVKKRYTREQLERLTTLQLRDICFEEKLAKGIANRLDKEEYIATILRFRGANEDFIIKKYNPVGYERLKNFIKTNAKGEQIQKQPIANPAQITVYKTLAIEPRDAYKVQTQNKELAETNVLLVDENYELCGIFHLLQKEDDKKSLYLCKSAKMPIEVKSNKNYRLLYFMPDESESLFEIYNGKKATTHPIRYFQVPLSNLEVKELETSRETLAIDFGTSNTTAGIYLSRENSNHFSQHDILNGNLKVDDINYVMFENIASEKKEWTELLPTVVGVKNCANPQKINYQYGYEVIRHDNLTGGNDLSSTFYEIKRWVNNYTELIELNDHKGNIATEQRGQIIANYIKYVIKHAEQQFKCRFKKLHISSPVKMKKQFIEMFKGLLQGYKFEEEQALDEGFAVLYNTISNQIITNTFEDGEEYKALIIDCGGGTTDLSSCTFTIEESKLNYHIKVNTTYENGDTNFGGNNLTYRIMQYIKILITNNYLNPDKKINDSDVMEVLVGDVYRFLDENGKEALYAKLEAKYQKCEKYLPTGYNNYLNKTNKEYMRVKANYHTLWRLANEIKQRFFEDTGRIILNLSKTKLNALTGFRLSIINNKKELEYIYKLPDVRVTLPAISGLIKGDIYAIIKQFLEKMYQQDELQEYSIIKMTGQSCRIDLFRDAIKEFIPGRQIDFRQKENHILDLKLSCLNGVLKYLYAKKTGMIRATIENKTPITPYSIYAYTHKQEKEILLTSSKLITQSSGFISKHRNTKEMIFYLEDIEKQTQATYLFINDEDNYHKTSYENIITKHGAYINQDDIDTIEDDEVKFFIYATDEQWGFNVLPIMRINSELKMQPEQYFPFENEQWELNFFDGKK